MAGDSSEIARRFIDRSLQQGMPKGRAARPSKAAYTRAVKLARLAIDELSGVAVRARAAGATKPNARGRS